MAAKSYDPIVWFLLKAIWCSVPKITWPALVKMVEEETKLQVPSPDTVRKKAASEKWAKAIRSYCQKSDKTLEKVKCRLLKELREEYEELQRGKPNLPALVNAELSPESGIPAFTESILEKVAYKNRKTIDVLQDHRRRTGKIGQLLDDSMDWMYEAKETLSRLYEPGEEVNDEQLNRALSQFNMLETMVEKIESFSRTSKNLMQMDFLLFGINTDDTRDSDTGDRISAIQDDAIFDQAREDLERQYLEMQQQTAWIQSGEFENEVVLEMEAQMRAEQAEDEEYMDDDEDDD